MSYEVRAGDTFEKVASVVYGDPDRANYLKAINSGITEPLQAGTTLRTPPASVKPTKVPTNVDDDDVTISIAGNLFDRWTKVTLNRYVDRVSDFALEAEFDPKNETMREVFTPLQFQDASIAVGRDQYFTGTVIDVSPEENPTNNIVTMSGYSRPGVLADCVLPIGEPVEFYDQNIQQIADSLLKTYSIEAVFNADPGAVFEPYVAITVSQSIWSFLTKLCAQRSLVMTSDQSGRLVFQNEEESGLFARIKQGTPPYISATSAFQPQQIFSSVTAAGPVVIGDQPETFTVDNPLLGDVFRPDVFEMRDAFGEELEIAARSRAGRMYANAATIEVTLEGWRNSRGQLWQPNTIVAVTASSIDVFREYKFLVRSVSLTKDNEGGLTTRLSLTFPGSFSGRLPEKLPWT